MNQATELCAEAKRIKFIFERDGEAAATDFAKRTLSIYRQALVGKKHHHAQVAQYRSEFIKSCIVFKRVIRLRTDSLRF